MTEKLDTELDQGVIKQTRHKIKPIRFRNDAINKVKKEHYEFGNKRYLFIPFSVDKDTHLRGLKLKISKGKTGSKHTEKTFFVQFWYNNRANKHKIGRYSQRFGIDECDILLRDLVLAHTDKETKLWTKDPNETRKNDKRIVVKPDTTKPKGFTLNETIEAYCGAEIPGEETERGFSKDR